MQRKQALAEPSFTKDDLNDGNANYSFKKLFAHFLEIRDIVRELPDDGKTRESFFILCTNRDVAGATQKKLFTPARRDRLFHFMFQHERLWPKLLQIKERYKNDLRELLTKDNVEPDADAFKEFFDTFRIMSAVEETLINTTFEPYFNRILPHVSWDMKWNSFQLFMWKWYSCRTPSIMDYERVKEFFNGLCDTPPVDESGVESDGVSDG